MLLAVRRLLMSRSFGFLQRDIVQGDVSDGQKADFRPAMMASLYPVSRSTAPDLWTSGNWRDADHNRAPGRRSRAMAAPRFSMLSFRHSRRAKAIEFGGAHKPVAAGYAAYPERGNRSKR